MAEIFNFYVQDNRTIQFPKNNLLEPIMQEDYKVATWRFRIPKTLNGIDMSGWAWWFVYINAKNEKFSELLTLVDDIDEPDSFCTADYDIDYGISYNSGSFSFSLEAINAESGGAITGEWHTKTYSHKVDKTLQGNQAQWAETESDIISALIIEVQNKVAQLVGGATPEPKNLVADMTDPKKVYLYVGSEEDESNGYWYYHNGTRFVPGGLYASGITVDAVPTQGSSNAVRSGGVWSALNGVHKEIDSFTETTRNINTVAMGHYNNTQSGNIYEQSSDNYYGMSAFVAVEPNTDYVISCGGIASEATIKTTVLLVDVNGNVLSRSGYNNANNRAITTPATADRIHVFYNSDDAITVGDDAYCQIEKGTSATPHIDPISAIDAISREIIASIEESITEKLGYKLQIAEGTDFDSIVELGIYTSIYARIPTYINYPSLFSGAIVVYSTNTIIIQMIIDSNNDIYTRYYNRYVWSAWIKHARNSDIEQLATRVDVLESVFGGVAADDGDIWEA